MTPAVVRSLFALSLLACSQATPPAEEPPPPAAVTPEPSAAPPPGPAPADSQADAGSKMCGGIAGIACPESQYCLYTPEAHCGAADMSGTCATVPDVCTMELNEVCGCDDKTYPNACSAARARVSVISKGACKAVPTLSQGQHCGTRGVNANCADGLYCKLGNDCGETDRGGTCQPTPKMCTKIYRPVCGCDRKTHSSDCVAASAGISVAREGACETKPKP